MVGKITRLNKVLVKNSKTFITPFDYEIESYYQEFEDFIKLIIEEVIKRGANAFCDASSEAVWREAIQKMGIVYRSSEATETPSDVYDQRESSSSHTALKLSADAIVFTLVVGYPKENDIITIFEEISDQAYEFGVPLIGEIDVRPDVSVNKGELTRQGIIGSSEENANIINSYYSNYSKEKSYYNNVVCKILFNTTYGSGSSKMVRALSAIIREGKEVNKAKRVLQVKDN
ncbi:MAG: hypothetical protein ACP5GH_01425 [Nitrososphaeria archaeon]|jgi:DhnA family fructose-bisphosphate aldolase class Ia